MLTIRLSRIGKKNQHSYRVIVSENKKDPQGNFLEDLGFYNPTSKKKVFNKERIKYWLSKGAQLSDTIHNLLVDEKIISEPKIKIFKIKTKAEDKEKQAVLENEKSSLKEAPASVKIEENKEKKPSA